MLEILHDLGQGLTCIDKDVRRGYQSAGELPEELQRFVDD